MSKLEFIEKGKLRSSVEWFAQQMEAKLRENDHKGGWRDCTILYLSMRLTQERKELKSAIAENDAEKIISECADVANFAMMIADKFKPSTTKQQP